MSARRRRRIVLTGAWGGGKTTLLAEIRERPGLSERVLFLPEAGPMARRMGFEVSHPGFERRVVRLQHRLEEAADERDGVEDRRAVLTHRGSLDALAFWFLRGGEPSAFFELIGSDPRTELARYDAVLLLRTAAAEAPEVYDDYRRRAGRGPPAEALELEKALTRVWSPHPGFFVVEAGGTDWARKSVVGRALVEAHLEPRTFPDHDALSADLARITYPSSHTYELDSDGRVRPGPTGRARIAEIESALPSGSWESLLDVGCAKGMFLLWAWQRFGLRRLVGVEAAADMVAAGRRAAHHLAAPATLLHGSFTEFHTVLAPADLVFVLHCYHYLFFGSPDGAPGIASHDELFRHLRRLTRDTLVFANPLFLDADKRDELRARGVAEEEIASYDRAAILESAERFFEIEETSHGGGRPLLLLRTR
jgi:SAM-dependent methyltransferase